MKNQENLKLKFEVIALGPNLTRRMEVKSIYVIDGIVWIRAIGTGTKGDQLLEFHVADQFGFIDIKIPADMPILPSNGTIIANLQVNTKQVA